MSLVNQICLVSLIAQGLLEFSFYSIEIHQEIAKSLWEQMVWHGLCQAQEASGSHLKLVKGLLLAISTPCATPSFRTKYGQPQPYAGNAGKGKMKARTEKWTVPNSPGGQSCPPTIMLEMMG